MDSKIEEITTLLGYRASRILEDENTIPIAAALGICLLTYLVYAVS